MRTNGTHSIVFGVAYVVLASSIMFGQQDRELAGIRGLPVEGHDNVAAIEVVGSKHIDLPKLRERLRSNGADLQLGLPLETQTLCRFKEVLRDVMGEKGFLDAEVTHDSRPTFGNPRDVTLKFTIVEGKRSRPIAAATLPSPAQTLFEMKRDGHRRNGFSYRSLPIVVAS